MLLIVSSLPRNARASPRCMFVHVSNMHFCTMMARFSCRACVSL